MKINQINSFKVGNLIKGFFLCKEKYFKSTRIGDPFIDVIIGDSTGEIRCKIWKNAYFYNEKFDVGNPVAIKGNIITYNNKIEIDIKNISSIKNSEYDEYGYSESLIVKTIDTSHKELWKIIDQNIKSLSVYYKIIISHLYEKYKKIIINIPSHDSKYKLHGGFVAKMINIFKINHRLIPLFKHLDKNKVISGILLKDIGCIKYFNEDLILSISKEGKFLNVPTLGVKLFNNEVFRIKTLEDDVKLFCQHIISVNDNSLDLEANYVNVLFKLDLQSLNTADFN